jgi:hypothetical protein
MSDDETIVLRKSMIGGKRRPDDFTVIWRELPIGRIMRAPGLPPHLMQWRWTCNFYGKPGGGGRISQGRWRRGGEAAPAPGVRLFNLKYLKRRRCQRLKSI